MSNQPWTQSFNVEDLSSSYRQNLDPEQILWLQIQRCNALHSQGDEILYGNAVKSLLINVPEDIRIEVEGREGEYHTVEKLWKPVGRFSANPEDPFITNLRGDLDYDPQYRGRRYEAISLKDKDGKETGELDYKEVYEVGGPHQISPVYVEDESWDYYVLQRLIMASLQEHGLTWKKERTEIFTGEEWDPAFDPPEEEEEGTTLEVDDTDEREQPKAN